MHLAVDLGTSFTKIYLAGSGIVLAEPSCLVLAAGTGRVLAVGSEAQSLLSGSRELLTVVRPVLEGEIADEEAAAAMLSHFLRKVGIPPRRGHGMEALLSVHCGASDESLARFRRVAEKSGIGIARFAEAPMLAAFGQGLEPDDERPVFAAEIGGGSTNIAALSARGIRQGVGLTLGSENLDAGIIAAVSEKLGVRLRRQEAARLKETVGSLYTGDNALPRRAGVCGRAPLHGHRARGRHCRARPSVCRQAGAVYPPGAAKAAAGGSILHARPRHPPFGRRRAPDGACRLLFRRPRHAGAAFRSAAVRRHRRRGQGDRKRRHPPPRLPGRVKGVSA